MKRRSFFRMLAGLACVPLLPRSAAKAPNLEFTVQGLERWTACTPYQPGDVITAPLPVATVDYGGLVHPAGAIVSFAGKNAPQGWQMCDGTVIDKDECPELAEVLPEFKLPDLPGFIIKADLSS